MIPVLSCYSEYFLVGSSSMSYFGRVELNVLELDNPFNTTSNQNTSVLRYSPCVILD